MGLHYTFSYISIKTLSQVFITTCIFAGVSQSAPFPARRETWNPYYYPTARSLSIPPTKPSTTTSTTRISTTTSRRPRIKLSVNLSADRRTSHSFNATKLKGNMKATGKLKFDTGNVTAIRHALNGFIKAAEVLVRELLISTNTGLLRLVGQVDQGTVQFQRNLQSSGLRLAFAGQQAAAQTYEALPPFVNQIIGRLITPSDGRSRQQLTAQLHGAVNNLRQLKKMLTDALDEHEKDFHNVFQDRFTQINQYLRVPGLPRKPLAWFS